MKKNIKTKIIKASHKLKSEYLFVELIFPDYKLLVAVYYNAPKVDEIGEFNDVIAEMAPKYAEVIMLGDFNENLLCNMSGRCNKCACNSCRTCRFRCILDTYGLKSLGSLPTNFDQTPSLIDLIITTNPNGFIRFGQLSSTISNHDILYASYSNPNISFEREPQFRRNFNAIKFDDLMNDVRNVHFEKAFQFTEVNAMTGNFSEKMVQLLDDHAPLKPFLPKLDLTASQRWCTPEIDKANIDAEIAKREYKADKNPDNRRQWHRLRNNANELIKYAKIKYYGPKLKLKLGSKLLWNNAKSLGVVSSKINTVRTNFTADEFNVHVPAPNNTNRTSSRNIATVTRTNLTYSPFAFRNVTHQEVDIATLSIKSDAVGLDKIPFLKFIKLMLSILD